MVKRAPFESEGNVRTGWLSLPFTGSFKRSMPFPLAHPAAVLPLRRFCPRYLSFPALIIGSLVPDLGYFSGRFRLGEFSHSFFAGSFAFCLPVGGLVLLVFYLVRQPMAGFLPARFRELLLPFCQRPAGSPVVIVISLVIGNWTHLLLDSMTHEDGWLVEYLSVLQSGVFLVGTHQFRVYDVLYAIFTFVGVAWLAAGYLGWLEGASRASVLTARSVRWGCAYLLASTILYIAQASRGPQQSLGIVSGGIFTLLLVIGFLAVTGMALKNAGD